MIDFVVATLFLLTLHRAATATVLHASGEKIANATAVSVVYAEIMKLFICASVLVAKKFFERSRKGDVENNHEPLKKPLHTIEEQDDEDAISEEEVTPFLSEKGEGPQMSHSSVQWQLTRWEIDQVLNHDCLVLALPSALLVLQNNLFLYAGSRLDPSIFQACWQLRIVATTIFSRCLLGTQVTGGQWTAIVGVVIGVTIIEGSSFHDLNGHGGGLQSLSALAAVLCAATVGGLALVILQKTLVKKQTNLWIALFQLSITSLFFTLIPLFMEEYVLGGFKPSKNASLDGLNIWTYLSGLMLAILAILNTMSTKYAGAIANNIVGAISIPLTTLFGRIVLSDLRFHGLQDALIILGAAVIYLSTHLYIVSLPRKG